MGTDFNVETIERLAKQLDEPPWLTERRRRALARHAELPWPHPSDDVWRRTDVSLLDPARGFTPARPERLHAPPVAQLEELTRPLADEQLVIRVNGGWQTPPSQGEIVVQDLSRAASRQPELLQCLLEADGLTDAEQKLTSLNDAFHHDGLCVQVPSRLTSARPLRLLHVVSSAAQQALFPLTVITVGEGSAVTIIDEYVSLLASSQEGPSLINSRIELVLERGARLQYIRLQRWGAQVREFLFQRAMLAGDASLTAANIALGAVVSKAHLVTTLGGERASAKLYGFVFGHGAQHVDQHTLQDHQAPHTTSDLQMRAALQDQSQMIYTGLIRIAKQAVQTDAYQANHNLMLSPSAKAETIPMLEILADDVQCKHGASIGPIDEEQLFYVMSRGVPRDIAQRFLVLGFVEPIVQQVPFEPLQERLRREIEGSLHE